MSNLVAFLTVESILKHKFTDYYAGHFVLEKAGRTEALEGDYEQLRRRLKRGWKLADFPKFHPTLKSLVDWAGSKGLLGELEEMARTAIPALRNAMVHPNFQQIVSPGMALTTVLRCAQIINQLFADT